MKCRLEEMMFKDGWKLTIRTNAGKVYREWTKEGYIIDEEDIVKDED